MPKRVVLGIMLTLLLVSMFNLGLNIQPVRASGVSARASFVVAEVEGSHFTPHPPPLGAVYGSTPTIDGTINVHEWSDATSRSFNNAEVFVKQDGENLYIALNVTDAPLMHIEEDCVQVLLDVDFDRNLSLQPDDVRLGVYRDGTPVEGNVTGGTWVFKEVSGWTAVVNSTFDVWQVEFNITYSKVNVVAGIYKDIGVSIGCALYPEEGSPTWVCWPPNTYSDMNLNPSSWGGITSAGYNWRERTASTRLPGVAPGQFMHYEIYSVWRDGNDTDLESWARNQPMSGMNVTVLSVVNSTVTYQEVTYNSTGIVHDSTQDVDVETGSYSYEYLFIAANLTAGDIIYTRDNNTWINETVLASYLGQQLETNKLASFVSHTDISFIGLPYYFSASVSQNYYWYRQGGMLLEVKFEFSTHRASGNDVLVGHLVLNAVASLFLSRVTGDLNLDGIVDISDAILAAAAFGSYPGHPRWNSQVDLNHDNIIDIFDIIILANNFGKH